MTWRGSYADSGLAGLEDLPQRGKPAQLLEALRDRVLELTLTEPPNLLWCDSLLLPAADHGAGQRGDADLARHRGPDLEPLRGPAVAGANVHGSPPTRS